MWHIVCSDFKDFDLQAVLDLCKADEYWVP